MAREKGGQFKLKKAEELSTKASQKAKKVETDSEGEEYIDSDEPSASEQDGDDSLDSEDIDDDDDEPVSKKKGKQKQQQSKKRKSSPVKASSSSSSPRKKKAKDDRNLREVETLEKVPGPKEDPNTSVILPTTLQFLKDLKKNNDRDWFAQHDARYRHALANWTAFVNALIPVVSEADWTVPELPAKDLLMRIYRDVRFSTDKTPYKTNFAAALSRTGRKGPYCLYYIQISPNGNSLIAAGKWQPDKNELATIRHNLLRQPKKFRKIISKPKFVELFGEAKAKGHGQRSNVFGHDDELKNCPKMNGVTKDHPDIDLLKLRSVAVVKQLKDEEILAPDFLDKLSKIITVMAPFVQYVNEMLVPTPRSDNDDEDSSDEEEESEGGDDGSDAPDGEEEED